jgi:uncharacterized protein YndB with AHSA1/START domain
MGEYQPRTAPSQPVRADRSGIVIFRRHSRRLYWRRNNAGELPMPYTYTLTSRMPASAQEIYDAWLDSLAHSEMTGGEARMSNAIGAEVSTWDGYISGSNLELVPGERIVQSWRTANFTDEHEDSIITVTLEPLAGGTLLTLVHSNVPDDQRSYEEGGWQSNYFEPMQEYFGGRQAKRAAKPSSAKRKTKRAAAAKSKGKRANAAKPGTRKPAKRQAGKTKSSRRRHR